MNKLEQLIIQLIEWYEPRLDRRLFWFKPIPHTQAEFEYSLQECIIRRTEYWYPKGSAIYFLKHCYQPLLKHLNSLLPKYRWTCEAPYWESTEINIHRTVALMAREGGIT